MARRVFDGRIKFALRKQLADGSHIGPLLPRSRFFPTDATDGRFIAVAAAGLRMCALYADGGATCWGYDPYGLNDTPTGQFTSLPASPLHACGTRPDGTVTCWGDSLTVSPPRGVQFV